MYLEGFKQERTEGTKTYIDTYRVTFQNSSKSRLGKTIWIKDTIIKKGKKKPIRENMVAKIESRMSMGITDKLTEKDEIDFVSSLYYFILDRDFETILYYSKYTGIVPISNPYSALSSSYGSTAEIPDVAIDYAYSYKEDLDPRILIDFNMLAQNTSYEKLSGTANLASLTNIPNSSEYSDYDPMNKKFYDNPLIVKEKTSGGDSLTPKYRFKLIYK